MVGTSVVSASGTAAAGSARLAHLEDLIARGKGAFIEVGKALAEIKRSQLYLLQGYASFARESGESRHEHG
jgi:hypothetical protein